MSSRTSGPPDPHEDLFSEDELDAQDAWSRDRGRLGVSDFVRRAIENTVGSVQTTGSVSKEALAYLLQQGDRGRREILRIVAAEVGQFLRDTDLSTELIKVLTGIQVELSANVKFKPAEGTPAKVEPKVDFTANVANARRSEAPSSAETPAAPPAEGPEAAADPLRSPRGSWLPGDPNRE